MTQLLLECCCSKQTHTGRQIHKIKKKSPTHVHTQTHQHRLIFQVQSGQTIIFSAFRNCFKPLPVWVEIPWLFPSLSLVGVQVLQWWTINAVLVKFVWLSITSAPTAPAHQCNIFLTACSHNTTIKVYFRSNIFYVLRTKQCVTLTDASLLDLNPPYSPHVSHDNSFTSLFLALPFLPPVPKESGRGPVRRSTSGSLSECQSNPVTGFSDTHG